MAGSCATPCGITASTAEQAICFIPTLPKMTTYIRVAGRILSTQCLIRVRGRCSNPHTCRQLPAIVGNGQLRHDIVQSCLNRNARHRRVSSMKTRLRRMQIIGGILIACASREHHAFDGTGLGPELAIGTCVSLHGRWLGEMADRTED